jgi:cobalt-zinc-cadmium efflux system membrane fusion protein
VGDAKARLLEACVTYDLKTKNFERLTSIKNTIAARELIEAEAALDLSRTQRFNALQKLINLGFELNLSEIESRSPDEVHQKLHLLGLPESFDAETASDNLIPVKAPFDGVVTHCEVVRGEMAEPAKSLYVLADTRRMWIRINLRPDDIDRVAAGSTVTFESESRQRPVTGTLTWIGTEIDPHTRTVQARAEVDNPLLHEGDDEAEGMRLLQAGAYGEAQVVVRQQPMAVVIPDEALRFQWEIGNEIVFIASEDGRTFSPRVVQKGLARDGSVQIVKGLEAGEKIVTLGSRVLSAELSDRLQEKLGDNAEAVRTFHHAHETAGPG